MPFLARLFTRARVVVLVHHVHREQWSILRPTLARFGWFMESKVAVRVNQGTPYVAVSEVTRSELVALGVRAQDITIAWNGQPAPPSFEPRRRATAPRLVVLSRLVPHKRVEHALEAVAALRDELPGLHLRVMGSGWWAEHLLERRRELGLDDAVTFLGHVTDREKFEELSAAWVHLLPSVKEGWGLVDRGGGPGRASPPWPTPRPAGYASRSWTASPGSSPPTRTTWSTRSGCCSPTPSCAPTWAPRRGSAPGSSPGTSTADTIAARLGVDVAR